MNLMASDTTHSAPIKEPPPLIAEFTIGRIRFGCHRLRPPQSYSVSLESASFTRCNVTTVRWMALGLTERSTTEQTPRLCPSNNPPPAPPVGKFATLNSNDLGLTTLSNGTTPRPRPPNNPSPTPPLGEYTALNSKDLGLTASSEKSNP